MYSRYFQECWSSTLATSSEIALNRLSSSFYKNTPTFIRVVSLSSLKCEPDNNFRFKTPKINQLHAQSARKLHHRFLLNSNLKAQQLLAYDWSEVRGTSSAF